ncbi:hypothetical protein FACS189465_1280 [Clostridia bacterium]|nr:hypothetical protein FACS189465_1280 [Clostridia bacterium]
MKLLLGKEELDDDELDKSLEFSRTLLFANFSTSGSHICAFFRISGFTLLEMPSGEEELDDDELGELLGLTSSCDAICNNGKSDCMKSCAVRLISLELSFDKVVLDELLELELGDNDELDELLELELDDDGKLDELLEFELGNDGKLDELLELELVVLPHSHFSTDGKLSDNDVSPSLDCKFPTNARNSFLLRLTPSWSVSLGKLSAILLEIFLICQII